MRDGGFIYLSENIESLTLSRLCLVLLFEFGIDGPVFGYGMDRDRV